MRIADRKLRLRQTFRMRAEHHRAGLGGAVGIGHRSPRQRLVQRRHQARADRRRAHAHEFDAGEIGRASSSVSRSIMAIIGGTAVSQVQRYFPIASI